MLPLPDSLTSWSANQDKTWPGFSRPGFAQNRLFGWLRQDRHSYSFKPERQQTPTLLLSSFKRPAPFSSAAYPSSLHTQYRITVASTVAVA
ncbi:hypothetical protein TrVGV298_005102 [Trichoderma virens]|nr:hypothetical protein TrVGV298_005102 [Trichoderma virens]